MKPIKTYHILEVANTHGGNLSYLFSLIKEFSTYTENFGMKFQPFKYSEIALSDFSDYQVYKKFFIKERSWKKIIQEAAKTKDVWLDIFDSFSVKVLKQNSKMVYGIKLQPSIVNNLPIVNSLQHIRVKCLILNISGFELGSIGEIISRFQRANIAERIFLQAGYQDYPTIVSQSGLNKISILIKTFGLPVSYGDHSARTSPDSKYLPILAIQCGASLIEKHVMHSSKPTKYDYYSSLNYKEFAKYLNLLENYWSSLNNNFVNYREAMYLKKTIQIPIAKHNFEAGSLISLTDDLSFKRSNKSGLNTLELRDKINNFNILRENINKNQPLKSDNFKKATIATIVAARLKSTRLPKKQIKKIGRYSATELCLKNALKFQNVNHTILATSTLESDQPLEKHAYSKSVVFHRGDPDDVIQRYLDVVNKLQIDIIIRVTGDNPFISDKVLQHNLKSHFENGADYTSATNAAQGTNLEIINASALRKIKEYFPKPKMSEYMSYYFINNPKYFRLNYTELPSHLVRSYRLTLDYPEDLKMFNLIEKYFEKENLSYDLELLFDFLDGHPAIAKINKDCPQIYMIQKDLMKKITKYTTIK